MIALGEQFTTAKSGVTGTVAEIVKNSMETCVDMGEIKLKATPIIGRSYGDCK